MNRTTPVRLTKIFTFEMAHALPGYLGDCKNLHGHSYRLEITVRGLPLHRPGHPNDGMVMDFKTLKKIVKNAVLDDFDHALLLPESIPADVLGVLKRQFEKVRVVPFQPTCELMLLHIVENIREALPPGVELWAVRLHETGTSFAEWCAADEV
jgi:6-pyruvoyltetrahydropterin/6-carboxytetrahydropterin synthase